jgi:hypothetical protein
MANARRMSTVLRLLFVTLAAMAVAANARGADMRTVRFQSLHADGGSPVVHIGPEPERASAPGLPTLSGIKLSQKTPHQTSGKAHSANPTQLSPPLAGRGKDEGLDAPHTAS